MTAEFPRTDITYADGQIVQLDIYVPEIHEDEIFVAFDLSAFCASHPLRGGITLNMNAEYADPGQVIDRLSHDYDLLRVDENTTFEERAANEDSVIINQHIGTVAAGGYVVGLSTFDMKRAAKEAYDFIHAEDKLQQIMDSFNEN